MLVSEMELLSIKSAYDNWAGSLCILGVYPEEIVDMLIDYCGYRTTICNNYTGKLICIETFSQIKNDMRELKVQIMKYIGV